MGKIGVTQRGFNRESIQERATSGAGHPRRRDPPAIGNEDAEAGMWLSFSTRPSAGKQREPGSPQPPGSTPGFAFYGVDFVWKWIEPGREVGVTAVTLLELARVAPECSWGVQQGSRHQPE